MEHILILRNIIKNYSKEIIFIDSCLKGVLMNENKFNKAIHTKKDNKIGNSLIRFFKYNACIDNVELEQKINDTSKIVILDLHEQDLVNKYSKDLRNSNKGSIPFTIIIGIEDKLEDYDKLFLEGADDLLESIRLLTHACGKKYYQYFCLPFQLEHLIDFLKRKIKDNPETLENPFKRIPEVQDLQEAFTGDNGGDGFFNEAGRFAIPEYRKMKRLEGFHEKKNIDHLLAMQFYDLALAYVKHKSHIGPEGKDDKENTFNVLLIENNPGGVIEELGRSLVTELKELVEKPEDGISALIKKLKEIVEKLGDNISNGSSLIKELKELVEKPEDGISALIKKLKEIVEKLGDNISNGSSLEFCLKKIEDLFGDYKFWIYKEDFPFLKDKLDSILDDKKNKQKKQKAEVEISKKVKLINDDSNKTEHKNSDLDFKNIDLILIDIFLDKEAKLSGIDFLTRFTLLYPEIPAFIMSGSEDTEVIGETIKGKADYYILKKHIFSLPFIYYKYLDELGRLISYINSRQLKRDLIGNIRYWRFKKELLWFGDKCYHMINHSYNHVENDWKIANQVVPPILDYLETKDKELGETLTDEDIYAFSMNVWLHDIGHKGNEHYGEPHEIRDLHGLISAEIFMKNPESYGIFGYNESKVSPYHWANFGSPKTAPQLIMERMANLEAAGNLLSNQKNQKEFREHLNKMTILEKISLMTIYHKSNFPLDEDDLTNFRKKGKRIPTDCYYNKNKETSPIHLESISTLFNNQNLLRLTALFRFVDGLDINQNRVGDNTEESVKKLTIKRDIKYQIKKLKDEVIRIGDIYLKEKGLEKRFFTLFYEAIVDEINKYQYISQEVKKEQRQFLDTVGAELPLDNYKMLTEHIEFISVQDGHFGLHNSIEKLEIKALPSHDNNNKKVAFNIIYKSRKNKDILDNKNNVEVKERGQKEGRSICDHLLGEQEKDEKGNNIKKKGSDDGYVRRELNNGKKYLSEWFDLKNTQILICNMAGKTLFKEYPLKEESNE
jgi:CheY-like chemotaxis protein